MIRDGDAIFDTPRTIVSQSIAPALYSPPHAMPPPSFLRASAAFACHTTAARHQPLEGLFTLVATIDVAKISACDEDMMIRRDNGMLQ